MAPALPPSPQKRVTRARTAAKKANEDTKRFKINKIASGPSKHKKSAIVEQDSAKSPMSEAIEPLRKSAKRGAAAASGRRVKVTPTEDTLKLQQPPPQETSSSYQATKKRRAARSKNLTASEVKCGDVDTEVAAEIANHPHRPGMEVKDAFKSTPPTLRSRAKKGKLVREEAIVETANPPRATRARTGAKVADTGTMTMPPSKLAVPKKKVTFQNPPECDKENQPVPQKRGPTKGKSAGPASGIRAKPVRRPAATSRAGAKQKVTKATVENTNQRVLTPKKAVQIAKSTSSAASDEDELNGAKTPIRDLSGSPRRNFSIAGTGSPAKIHDLGARTLKSSPVKPQLASTLLSPAKRPAPSPFKEALKESPKRGDFSLKLSQVAKSVEIDQGGGSASLSNTMLLQTPKRVAFETSTLPRSMSKAGRSPFKASLLQSPPKRPISPVKASSTSSAKKDHMTPFNEFNVDMASPNVTVSSHFRASKSPERSSRVHRMTAGELVDEARCGMNFDESVVDIRSPLKLNNDMTAFDQVQGESAEERTLGCDLGEGLPVHEVGAHANAQVEELVAAEEFTTAQVKDFAARSTAHPSTILRDQTPVNPASLLFRSSYDDDGDESSEDELQSPIRNFQERTPASVLRIEPCHSIANQVASGDPPGLTPLAAQLSGWLASSPEKHSVKKKHQQRGLFSPVAAQHVPGEVIIDRQSPATSSVSAGPRLSISERRSIEDKRSACRRSSLAAPMSEVSCKSTYFADEMALKDLEEEIEKVQTEGQIYDILEQASSTKIVDIAAVDESPQFGLAEPVEVVEAHPQNGHDRPAPQATVHNVASISDEVVRTLSPKSETAAALDIGEDRQLTLEACLESATSSAYGDENDVPPTSVGAVQEGILVTAQHSCSAMSALSAPSDRAPFGESVTPTHAQIAMPRFANTVVSKVPLRPEGGISPIKIPKKRSRSLSTGPSSARKTPNRHASGMLPTSANSTLSPTQDRLNTPSTTAATPGQQSFMIGDFGDSTLDGIEVDEDDENLPPATPTAAGSRFSPETSSRTPQAEAPARPYGVLQGAVVFVDVHTTEGADASGIFVELLSQMGAKCVRHWSWNPRGSVGLSMKEGSQLSEAGPEGGRIGITHVVYKDGGKRTLEKVRDTEGVVKCVGVGWVLDCERENEWLDEWAYMVDISIFPRGGSRRRKSMEPKALLNIDGNLSRTSNAGRRSFSAEATKQMRDELINTPLRGRVSNRLSESPEPSQEADAEAQTEHTGSEESGLSTPTGILVDGAPPAPATPTGFVNYDPSTFQPDTKPHADSARSSPTTPYYLSQGAKLVQMTCPPKQSQKGLFEPDAGTQDGFSGADANGAELRFPISGRLGDVNDEAVKKRLAEARRRTMGWKPRVASPLGR